MELTKVTIEDTTYDELKKTKIMTHNDYLQQAKDLGAVSMRIF